MPAAWRCRTNDRYERIRDTLGEFCGIVELARVDESDGSALGHRATRRTKASKMDQDAARELVDALGADMMLVAANWRS